MFQLLDSHLLEKLQLPGEEVVFLDDIGANLSAARKVGITTIKVADIHTAIGELQVSLHVKNARETCSKIWWAKLYLLT